MAICSEFNCGEDAIRDGRCAKHPRPKRRPGSTRRYRRNRAAALARDKGICHICGLAHADSADHLLRDRDGGTDDTANLAAAHLSCNIARG